MWCYRKCWVLLCGHITERGNSNCGRKEDRAEGKRIARVDHPMGDPPPHFDRTLNYESVRADSDTTYGASLLTIAPFESWLNLRVLLDLDIIFHRHQHLQFHAQGGALGFKGREDGKEEAT